MEDCERHMLYKLMDFDIKGDYDGKLVALEGNCNVPFAIKRVYYIYDTLQSVVRGKHAHRSLEQIIICVSGSCDFMLDSGMEKAKVHLNNPSRGLYIKHNIWREFTNFSPDCVVIVLASQPYDESDYIRDYDVFLKGAAQ